MVFTSFVFLVFLAVTVGLYFSCPVKYRWIVLLLASVCFYCNASLGFVPFIVVTTLLSYGAARMIDFFHAKLEVTLGTLQIKEEKSRQKAICKQKCRRVMAATIILIVGYLCYTKFATRLFRMLAQLFTENENGSHVALLVIVPLGISYYTFSTVGYVLDIYWRRYPAERNFFKYLLYVMYFPHILQGPIARYDRLGAQFFEEHRFDYKRVCFGVQLMVWGFFQKLVIADRLSPFVQAVYDDYGQQSGGILLVATLFYSVQIYADFSGCVNIAKGMSQIFGIQLEDNFRQPYFSRSVEEFWRRWHITLGAWFKDYLCMPVSASGVVKKLSKAVRNKWGNQAGKKVTTVCALVVVWICTGVWHGTGMNYVCWGMWQGGIIIASVLCKETFEKMKKACHVKEQSLSWNAFLYLRTFILTGIIPRIITRAPSLAAAGVIFRKIVLELRPGTMFSGSLFSFGLDEVNFVIGVFGILVLFVVSLLRERGVSIRESIARMPLICRWGIYLAAFYSVVIFGIYGPGYDASAFVYMGF